MRWAERSPRAIVAFSDDDVQSKADGLGRAVLLAKPFGSEELLSLVRRASAT